MAPTRKCGPFPRTFLAYSTWPFRSEWGHGGSRRETLALVPLHQHLPWSLVIRLRLARIRRAAELPPDHVLPRLGHVLRLGRLRRTNAGHRGRGERQVLRAGARPVGRISPVRLPRPAALRSGMPAG